MVGLSRDRTCPADVLVPNWVLGKPAAFDLSVTSTLNVQISMCDSRFSCLGCPDPQASSK